MEGMSSIVKNGGARTSSHGIYAYTQEDLMRSMPKSLPQSTQIILLYVYLYFRIGAIADCVFPFPPKAIENIYVLRLSCPSLGITVFRLFHLARPKRRSAWFRLLEHVNMGLDRVVATH